MREGAGMVLHVGDERLRVARLFATRRNQGEVGDNYPASVILLNPKDWILRTSVDSLLGIVNPRFSNILE